jgi:hypothetical protein
MNKITAINAKKGRKAKATVRPITDKGSSAKAVVADKVVAPAGVSVTSAAPGFKTLNRGGYKAFVPGPAAKKHQNPFGVIPEYQNQFYR